MVRRLTWALLLVCATPVVGAATTSPTAAAVPAVTMSSATVATGARVIAHSAMP